MVQSATVEAHPVDARDLQAFETVARSEARRLFGIAYTILRDPAEAEDAVQDVMVRAWRAWHRTGGFGDQGPWLTRICVNRCLSHRIRLRLRSTRETELDAQAGVTGAPSPIPIWLGRSTASRRASAQ
jgi:RNA polymerase sigma-70 factor (ECF subfamily)